MEECRSRNSKKLGKKDKISLDDYLDFLFSNKQLVLTVDYLNQIIRMHGYRKIFGVPKKALTDAVSTIDLVHPSRSTLNESVSSSAFIPLEDIILDLTDLNWQECRVTSVLTFNSWKQNHSDPSLDHQEPKSKQNARELECLRDLDAIDGVSSSCASKEGRKLGPKSKRKKTTAQSGVKDGSLDHSSLSSVQLGSS